MPSAAEQSFGAAPMSSKFARTRFAREPRHLLGGVWQRCNCVSGLPGMEYAPRVLRAALRAGGEERPQILAV